MVVDTPLFANRLLMFHTFYSRVLMLVVGLVLIAQLTTFGAVLRTIDSDVKSRTRVEIEKGSILVGRQIEAMIIKPSDQHWTTVYRELMQVWPVLSHWMECSKSQHIMPTRSPCSMTQM